MSLRILLSCLVLLTISACGPMYRTQYNYTSPASWEGRQCANQCIKDKSYCRQNCDRDVQNCRNIESIKEAANIAIQQNTKQNPNDPFKHNRRQTGLSRNDCSNDYCYNNCDSDYNACFVNCGGSIETKQVCVMNCDKAGSSDFLF